ncbi:MAG: immunoglobulin-like domain-containing protein [Patescibacteria group bacterium]
MFSILAVIVTGFGLSGCPLEMSVNLDAYDADGNQIANQSGPIAYGESAYAPGYGRADFTSAKFSSGTATYVVLDESGNLATRTATLAANGKTWEGDDLAPYVIAVVVAGFGLVDWPGLFNDDGNAGFTVVVPMGPQVVSATVTIQTSQGAFMFILLGDGQAEIPTDCGGGEFRIEKDSAGDWLVKIGIGDNALGCLFASTDTATPAPFEDAGSTMGAYVYVGEQNKRLLDQQTISRGGMNTWNLSKGVFAGEAIPTTFRVGIWVQNLQNPDEEDPAGLWWADVNSFSVTGPAVLKNGLWEVTISGTIPTGAPVITLVGSTSITITVGGSYSDAGAIAVDGAGSSVSVSVSGSVNTSVAGTYTLTYSATANGKTTTVTRTVIVTPAVTSTAPVITLAGSTSITITVGGIYNDPGYTATDGNGNTVTVTVSGSVNTSIAGTYTITYTATSGGKTTTVTRTVIVQAASTTTYAMTTNVSPSGTGTVTGGGNYNSGSTATLTATANPNFVFDYWTGDLSGSTNPGSVTMSGNKTVTAVFKSTNVTTGVAILRATVNGHFPNATVTFAFDLNGATLSAVFPGCNGAGSITDVRWLDGFLEPQNIDINGTAYTPTATWTADGGNLSKTLKFNMVIFKDLTLNSTLHALPTNSAAWANPDFVRLTYNNGTGAPEQTISKNQDGSWTVTLP